MFTRIVIEPKLERNLARAVCTWPASEISVVCDWILSERLGRFVEPGIFADGVAVVTLICEQRLRPDIINCYQRFVLGRIMGFAGRDDEAEREMLLPVAEQAPTERRS